MLNGDVSFFNKLETKRKLCSICPLLFLTSSKGKSNSHLGVVLFFNELETKRKLCSIGPLLFLTSPLLFLTSSKGKKNAHMPPA